MGKFPTVGHPQGHTLRWAIRRDIEQCLRLFSPFVFRRVLREASALGKAEKLAERQAREDATLAAEEKASFEGSGLRVEGLRVGGLGIEG